MRTLSMVEVENVSGAAVISLPYVMTEAVEFGAMGVLGNILLNGVTAATIGHGLLLGACVGASYGVVRSIII